MKTILTPQDIERRFSSMPEELITKVMVDKFIMELRNLVSEVAEYALDTDNSFISQEEQDEWYSKIDKMVDSKAKKLFDLANKKEQP